MEPHRDGPRSRVAWDRLWELFHAALEREGTERAAFLAGACAGEPAMRAELERLLAAHGSDALLDRPPPFAAASVAPSSLELTADAGELPPGELLAGRFEIVGCRGAGGMGVVYEAQDHELGSRVALKMLLPGIAADPAARQRFRREITLARRVSHPNACRVFDLYLHHGGAGEVAFVTMELLRGETLADRLAERGPLSPAEVLPLAEQVAAALDAAHRQGVVHRDLKPANVRLVGGATAPRAVVMDFGVARAFDAAAPGAPTTAAGQLLGTPAYMAPEQLQGKPVTPAADVYGFGLLLYELLTGELPHAGDTPLSAALKRLGEDPAPLRRHRPDLDPRWDQAILRCLAREPSDRFPSAGAAVDALRATGGARRLRRLLPLRGRTAAAVGLVLVLLGGLAALLLPRLAAPPPGSLGAGVEIEPPWVLVGDFDNRTGEELLDGTVTYALRRELADSRFLRVATPERVGDALRLMALPADTPLDRDLACEVALRDGGLSAVVSGRIDRLGAIYALSAELLDPASSQVLAAFVEEAPRQEAVLAAVRRLASRLRAALGETPAGRDAGEERLAHVTTPSLPALRLFTRGEALIAQGFTQGTQAAAEDLLRQAVAADPEFASAWIYLAYAIGNQAGPREEASAAAERALGLSAGSSERERAFIRASAATLGDDWERAIVGFQGLLSLYPDDFWAHSNLASLFEQLDRHGEAVPHALASARLRPHLDWTQLRAARALSMWANRPEAAEPYLRRVEALLAAVPRESATFGWNESWLLGYRAHRHWVAGDSGRALARVEDLGQRLPELSGRDRQSCAWMIAHLQRALGRYRAAEAHFGDSFPPSHRAHLLAAAFLAGGIEAAPPHLERSLGDSPVNNRFEPLRLMLLAKAGREQEAAAGLTEWLRQPDAYGVGSYREIGRPPPSRIAPPGAARLVRGELALAAGDPRGAIPLLERGLREEQAAGSSVYFLAATSLADAYLRLGEPTHAVRVLEAASGEQHRAYLGGEAFWALARWRLAELYGELGQAAEAAAVEAELRHLFRLADDDFWLWRRLPREG
ncbi:MAG TPA: serine/threonine-protein kinase [Thermoanaerobaculia bacterium]|nr:serine/threonine-protein kinase [Thermoanaerobaculia bacterium]